MKKIITNVVLMLAVVAMSVACSKEESSRVSEENLIGIWKAPVNIGDGAVQGISGKKLIIYPNHKATFASLEFNHWKLEGDELTFTNYTDHGVDCEVDVLKYTIVQYADTVITLVGTYTQSYGDSLYLKADLSAMFQRQAPVIPLPIPQL